MTVPASLQIPSQSSFMDDLILQRTDHFNELGGGLALSNWFSTGEKSQLSSYLAANNAVPYFLVKVWQDMEREIVSILGDCREAASGSVVSIGPGNGLFEYILYTLAKFNKILLIDIEATVDHQHGFNLQGSGYASLQTTREFMMANGVPDGLIEVCNPRKQPLPTFPCDLLLSTLSMAFHYPSDDYADFVIESVRPKGYLVLDKRKDTVDRGFERLMREFQVKRQFESDKSVRFILSKPAQVDNRPKLRETFLREVKPDQGSSSPFLSLGAADCGPSGQRQASPSIAPQASAQEGASVVAGPSVAAQMSKWSEAVPSEVQFWSMWLKTRGAEWPEDYRFRLDPGTQVSAFIRSLLHDRPHPRILDVGAGPITCLGKKMGEVSLQITACDPLADVYAELLRDAQVDPPVKTERAFAEDLSFFYDFNSFDLVHCRNALDHSFDPLRGIEEMLLLTAPGGYVVLEHATDEAEHAGYEGFHQWNFNVENGRFVIWNRSQRLFVDQHVSDCSMAKMEKNGRMVTLALRKTGASRLDVVYKRMRSRARELVYPSA